MDWRPPCEETHLLGTTATRSCPDASIHMCGSLASLVSVGGEELVGQAEAWTSTSAGGPFPRVTNGKVSSLLTVITGNKMVPAAQ